VARAAADAGATILNDVSGLSADPEMRAAAVATGARVVITHMRGTPATMQRNPVYAHVVLEVIADLIDLTGAAVDAGIPKERILLDPGFGFGKRPSDNVALLRHLASLVSLGYPVLAGLSRKSFLGAMDSADEGPASAARADTTLAAETLAAASGAAYLRTHDVARAARAVRLAAVVTSTQGEPGDTSVDRRADSQPL
jgi:dihydropteroate synthase